jgi:hypothetical protein
MRPKARSWRTTGSSRPEGKASRSAQRQRRPRGNQIVARARLRLRVPDQEHTRVARESPSCPNRPKARLPRTAENDVNPATAIAQAAQFTRTMIRREKLASANIYVPGVERLSLRLCERMRKVCSKVDDPNPRPVRWRAVRRAWSASA